MAGSTLEEISANSTSLVVKQHKKCAHFTAFHLVFGQTPAVKPKHPKEVGSHPDLDSPPDSQVILDSTAALIAVPASFPLVVAAPATGATPAGKGPAAFHLQPSKKQVKMDLGEAYLKAQQIRIESIASVASSKQRSELIVALLMQGKTTTDIAAVLKLAGL